MSLLSWSNAFSVGVKEIDDQHKKLVQLANELNDAMKAGHGKEALGKILGELISYTATHFATEERLMERNHYPKADEHKKQHQDLVKSVLDLKSKFDAGNATLTAEVMVFLRDWLSQHIINSDRALGKDLIAKGIH